MTRRPVSLLGRSIFAPFALFFLLANKAGCEVYTSLQWSPENPMFMTNTMKCPGGEFPQMNVLLDSTFHMICPTPVTVLETVQSTKPKQNLFENLWIVYDQESFETCNVNTTNAVLDKKRNRPLMECNKPLELKYFTIVFQQFSAVGGGLEFTPGNDYYFLATSDSTVESLNNTAGGHCNDTKNGVSMRFKVYVCKENDPKCADETAETMGKLKCNSIPTPGVPTTTQSSTSALSTSTSSIPDVVTKSPRKEAQTGDCTTNLTWMILFILSSLLLLLDAAYHCKKCTQKRAAKPQDAENGLSTGSAFNDAFRESRDFSDGKVMISDSSNVTSQEPQEKKTNEKKPLNNFPKQGQEDKAPGRVSLQGRRSNNNITNEWSTNQML